MNNFIKEVIEETFASKAQQRFFYAKANEKSSSKKEKKKWGKWAKEFSDKTDFEKIPDKVEEVEEIVDANGEIQRSKVPPILKSKGITSKSTTDDVVKSGMGQMGNFGVAGGTSRGQVSLRYWGENDQSKLLGQKETIGNNKDYDDAEAYFEKNLGLDDEEAQKKLDQLGYDKDLPDGKVRLIELTKKSLEEYIDNLIAKKSKDKELVKSDQQEDLKKDINPIIKKQLKSLKDSLKNNDLTINDILSYLKDNE